MLANFQHISWLQNFFADLLAIDIGTVGTAQILDMRDIEIGYDAGVMLTYRFVIQVQAVVLGAANGEGAGGDFAHGDGLAVT